MMNLRPDRRVGIGVRQLVVLHLYGNRQGQTPLGIIWGFLKSDGSQRSLGVVCLRIIFGGGSETRLTKHNPNH